jgi:glycosyltransferase involved in cell wall biosynthesis
VPGLSLSIVTPTLDAERYLADCLTSVWTQQWPELEQLVIDGGSTDRTEQLVRASNALWLSGPA